MIALLISLGAFANVPSVHAEHAMLELGALASPFVLPSPMPLPDPTPGPTSMVYGYMAYWSGDLEDMPWDQLSHIALFSANVDTAGVLSRTDRWGDIEQAVAIGDMYGVKVHLCVTNFNTSELATLLGSETAKSRLIADLKTIVDDSGAAGVNIDFEGLPSSRRNEMVTFIADLQAAVGEVVIATPSVDWQDAWDHAALTEHADLFIMGYGYHWSGSDNAGPVDPLYAGDTWSKWSLSWSVDDYIDAGADPSRIILGLPLYGYSWPTADNTVPTDNLGTGSSVIFSTAWTEADTYGRSYDPDSATPYYYTGSEQVWYGDVDSVTERVHYAIDEKSLGGVGVWALNYTKGDPALWSAIATETTVIPDAPALDCDPEFSAATTSPFLAYVGDTAEISGEPSEGPSGLSLRYEWTQVAGPTVALNLTVPARPTFEVAGVGTHAFDLRVGDGTRWSCPVSTYVAVLDPDAGRRHQACGCAQSPAGAPAWLLALGLLAIRRRKAATDTLTP